MLSAMCNAKRCNILFVYVLFLIRSAVKHTKYQHNSEAKESSIHFEYIEMSSPGGLSTSYEGIPTREGGAFLYLDDFIGPP